MTAAVMPPVMVRKMVQLRDGSRGRKFSPKPKYFQTGLGGLSGFVFFASGFGMSAFGAVAWKHQMLACALNGCGLITYRWVDRLEVRHFVGRLLFLR